MFDVEQEQKQIIDRLQDSGKFYDALVKKNDKWEKRFLYGSFLFMFPSLLIPLAPVKFFALVAQIAMLTGFLITSKRGMKIRKERLTLMESEHDYIRHMYE